MTDTPLCEKLDWDSNFFGVSIARAVPHRGDASTCREMLDWCSTHGIDCLYFLADDDPATLEALERASFVRVDERVTLERAVGPAMIPAAGVTRGAREEDIPALRAIAGASHRDSRFYNDGRFDPVRCDEFYRVWIENSCRGWADYVVVAERDGAAIGYLTLHRRGPDVASIGLVGVDPALRRHGIGSQLLEGALGWLADRSIARVSLATQGRNSASQGFVQKAGFRRVSTFVWYHHWLTPQVSAER